MAAVDDAVLDDIEQLYERSLFVQALRRAESACLLPLATWHGTRPCVLGGRLAAQLGAPSLGGVLARRATRTDPDDLRAHYFWAAASVRRTGPWRVLHLLRRRGMHDGGDGTARADLLALRGVLHAQLRDFDVAYRDLDAADEVAGRTPWLGVQRAEVLELDDRYDDALATARAVLEQQPHYRAAVWQLAHLLQLRARDADAVALLQEESARGESAQLATLLSLALEETGDPAAALDAVEQAAARMPLAEPPLQRWLDGRRSDLHARLGDIGRARHFAQKAGGFHTRVAEHLANAGTDAERVQLEVPFVRQHHMTCGPATLVALAGSFGRDLDHLHVADEICYGGTSAAAQRRWALSNGFAAREFTLQADSAHELLRRGFPFAVSTIEATSAHLQAVSGFDLRRGTLLVRDPYVRTVREWATEEFLDHYRSTGPRALLLLPEDRAAAVADLALADEALYDDDFAVQEALRTHDHAGAEAAYRRMAEAAPDHRLTIHARWALSAYERDSVGAMVCVHRLLEQFPDDQLLQLRLLWYLADLERADEKVQLLEQLAATPGHDPVFRVMLAEHCLARDPERAVMLLRRVLRWAPGFARAHRALGHALAGLGHEDDAARALRFAACLDETDESLAHGYFDWCRLHGRGDEALAFLDRRNQRCQGRSAWPAITLARALLALGRDAEAERVEADIRAARPDDGDLLLHLGQRALQRGDVAAAEEALQRASGSAYEPTRLSVQAACRMRAGDGRGALACWQRMLAREPLNHEAREQAFALLATLDGRQRALAWLREAADEFPFVQPLRRLLARELAHDDPAAAEQVLRDLLDEHPTDAWAHRELALRLLDQGRTDAAVDAARAGAALEPRSPSSPLILGHALAADGQRDAAVAQLRAALDLDVDCPGAIDILVRLAATPDAVSAVLDDVQDRLASHASDGTAIDSFAAAVSQHLPDAEARARLQRLRQERPHDHGPTRAEFRHLLAVGAVAEARALAEDAAAHFATALPAWLDLAAAHRAAGDVDGEAEALTRAAALSPWAPEVAWYRALLHEKRGEADAACALLLDLLGRSDDNPPLRALLAAILARAQRWDEAVAQARQALWADPHAGAAWSAIETVAGGRGDPELPARIAGELTEHLPGRSDVWRLLAERLPPPELDRRVQACTRALDLDPTDHRTRDLCAEVLAEAGRLDAARAVIEQCPGEAPMFLHGRLAWLLHRRGQVDAAIAAMREVVAQHPYYAWGCAQLVEWVRDAGSPEQYVAAARAYVAAAPNQAVPHGWLGDALRRAGDHAAALRAFSRAMELDTDYHYAGVQVARLCREAGDLDGAARAAEWLQRHEGGSGADTQLLLVAAERGDRAGVEAALRRLCREHGDDTWALDEVTPALLDQRLGTDLRPALEQEMATAAGPLAATLWMRTFTRTGDWRGARRALVARRTDDAAWGTAAAALLDDMIDAGRMGAVLRLARGGLSRRLREHDEPWAKVGYVFARRGDADGGMRWTADWAQRPGLLPWMLINVAWPLRHRGRWHAAAAASQRALAAGPADLDWHRVWLAADAVLAGRDDEARALLAAVDRRGTVPEHLLALLEAFLSTDTPGEPAMARARRAIAAAGRGMRGDRGLRLVAARLARRAARGAGPAAKVWAAWQRIRAL